MASPRFSSFSFSPRIRLLAGAFLISFSSVFANLASVPPTVSGFYRVAIGGVVLSAVVIWKRCRFSRRPAPLWLLAAAGLLFALDLGFWHRSIGYIGPGLSTLLASFQVFFMTAAGYFFFKQVPSRAQMAAVPLALAGLALIAGVDWQELPEDYRWGIVLGLLTGLTYAGYLLTLRQVQRPGVSQLPIAELAAVSMVTAAFLAVAAGFEGNSLVLTKAEDAVWLSCYGVICHVLGWILIASSLPRLRTAVAGLILTLQPVLTVVWDVLIFGRAFSALEAAGMSLTVGAIYLGSGALGRRSEEG